MSGRPVHLLAAAAIVAAASIVSIEAASAGCYSCGQSYGYQAPVAYYTAPVVYSYSYAAPAAYAAPSCGCGSSYSYAAPSYVVNQGPAYTAPVVGYAEPTPAYEEPAPSYGYRRAAPSYSEGGYGYQRRHWHRGYRNYGGHYGYRGYGYRNFGMNRHRYGAVVPGARFGMRHPMAGPRAIFRGLRHAGGMTPGFVHPRPMMGGGPRAPMHPMHQMHGGPKKKMP